MCENTYDLADLSLFGKFAVLEVTLIAAVMVNIESLT